MKTRISIQTYLSSTSRSLHADQTPMDGTSMEAKKFQNISARIQPPLPRCNKFLDSGDNFASEHKLEPNQEPWESELLKEEILKLKLNQLNLVSKDFNGMGFNELQQLERKMLEGLTSVKTLKLKNEANVSKEKVLKLKLKQLQVLVKDLSGMGFYELDQVEQELNKGLLFVLAWKDELRLKQMEQSKVKVGSRRATAIPAPICFGYYREEKKERPAKRVFESQDASVDGDSANGYYYYLDKNLYLWHYSLLVLLLCVWFLLICLAMVLF